MGQQQAKQRKSQQQANGDQRRRGQEVAEAEKKLLKQRERKEKILNAVIKPLEMSDEFPSKISFHRIIQISETTRSEVARDPQVAVAATRPWNLLRRLMANRASFSDNSEDQDEENDLHPSDILLACFLCCDKELQQILCQRLFTCKLAFPFVYPDSDGRLVRSLWSLRDIVIEYRDEEDKHVEAGLVSADHSVPIVSFVRVGELDRSKSEIVNGLLDSRHATFIHRDCPDGDRDRRISDGVVEASVSLPSGNTMTGLNRPALVLNLRGDLMNCEQQVRIIVQVSHILVVFVKVENLPNLPGIIDVMNRMMKETRVVLVACRQNAAQHPSQEMQRLQETVASTVDTFKGKRRRNEADLLSEIRASVNQLMSTDSVRNDKRRIESKMPDELMDENEILLQLKVHADEVSGFLRDTEISHFKQRFLPLQEIWQEFSKLHKMENSSKQFKEDLLQLQAQKMKQREKQLDCCINMSEFIRIFIKHLQSLSQEFQSGTGLEVRLFLQWMRIFFDQTSRKHLPPLSKERNDLRTQLQEAKNKQDKKEAASLTQQLQKVEQKIVNSSVGLENVFREIGQVFEAVKENSSSVSQDLSAKTQSLPIMFAQLLLWGIPLEILDGDASNIATSWVEAVLNSCQDMVGDKKIFVISVLGLQSSGKSTLLNTMFGLKFPVSAGRCTRGAFLQLVTVDASSGLPFDFVAVIDTEGLRAPELALEKYQHDNELATLVIGLGDVTLINIKGENTAEMKDILQIAVHAFIRMKMANKMHDLHRKCIFVHQNVPAVGAKEKMSDAAFKMQQSLDEITREAAEGEGLRNITSFSQILEFNRDTDIFYMPDLWHGDPPMAPVNPGYSLKVQEVKHSLLQTEKSQMKSFLNFKDFSLRVNDMWTAIMSEDFVFSFKNSIEMKAYNQMEVAFFELLSHMESEMKDWLHKTATVQVKKCQSTQEVLDKRLSLVCDLRNFSDRQVADAVEKLEKFFKDNQYSEYTIQWKEKKLNSIRNSADDKQNDIIKKIDGLCRLQQLETQQKASQTEWKKMILRSASQLAETLKPDEDEQKLKDEFESMWNTLLQDLPQQQDEAVTPIEHLIAESLRQRYQKEWKTVNFYLQHFPFQSESSSVTLTGNEVVMKIQVEGETEPKLMELNFSLIGKAAEFFHLSSKTEKKKAAAQKVAMTCQDVIHAVMAEIEQIKKQSRWFESTDTNCVIETVQRVLVASAEALRSGGISTTIALEIKLVVMSLSFAFPTFVAVDKKFRDSHSVKAKLEEMNQQVFNMFINMVKQQTGAKIAADFCRDHVAKMAKEAIERQMTDKLKMYILPKIGQTKNFLIVKMLSDMGNREDFQGIIEYVKDSYSAAQKWLEPAINKMMFEDKKVSGDQSVTVFSYVIEVNLISKIFECVMDAAADAKRNSGNSLKSWINGFCDKVQKELPVTQEDLMHMCECEIHTVDDVADFFQKGVLELKKQTVNEYRQMQEKDVNWQGQSLCSKLLKEWWSCKEQCPFCNEPCSRTSPDEVHFCKQHRPTAVNGVSCRDSQEFEFSTCGFDVMSDISFSGLGGKSGKYKEYKKCFPNWEIEGDTTNTSSKFWMWFCWHFQQKIRSHYGVMKHDPPDHWKNVSKKEAIDSLSSLLK